MILKLQVTSNKLTDIRFQINRRRKLKLRFSDRQLVGARNNGVKSCFMWRFLDVPIVHLHNVTLTTGMGILPRVDRVLEKYIQT